MKTTPEADKDRVIDELIKEVRGLHKQLTAVKEELYKCPDMDRLSVPGAVRSLVSSKEVLLEVMQAFASANRNRIQPDRLLDKLDKIISKL